MDSTVTSEYPYPGNALVTRTSYVYNNDQYLQPNAIRTLSSKGEVIELTKNYPAEMVAIGKDSNGVYVQMIAERNLMPVIEEMKKVNNQLVS